MGTQKSFWDQIKRRFLAGNWFFSHFLASERLFWGFLEFSCKLVSFLDLYCFQKPLRYLRILRSLKFQLKRQEFSYQILEISCETVFCLFQAIGKFFQLISCIFCTLKVFFRFSFPLGAFWALEDSFDVELSTHGTKIQRQNSQNVLEKDFFPSFQAVRRLQSHISRIFWHLNVCFRSSLLPRAISGTRISCGCRIFDTKN